MNKHTTGPQIIRAPNEVDAIGIHFGSNVQKAEVLYDDGDWIHRCEGSRMDASNPNTFLLWTLCEKDVPAGNGYVNARERVTCEQCIAKIQERK